MLERNLFWASEAGSSGIRAEKKRTSSRWNQLTLGKCETIPYCVVFLIVSGVQPLLSLNSIPKMWNRMKSKPDKPMRHLLKFIKNSLDFLDLIILLLS